MDRGPKPFEPTAISTALSDFQKNTRIDLQVMVSRSLLPIDPGKAAIRILRKQNCDFSIYLDLRRRQFGFAFRKTQHGKIKSFEMNRMKKIFRRLLLTTHHENAIRQLLLELVPPFSS